MRGNRNLLILIIALVVIVGGGLVALLLLDNGGEAEVEIAPTPTPTPRSMQIVVSAQNIPRGYQFRLEDTPAIRLEPWPEELLPVSYYSSTNELYGMYAAMDIPRGIPMHPDMLTQSEPSIFPAGAEGRVAYAVPMDTQGAVAWAIQEGDRVDVLAAIQMIPVDQEFQAQLPNEFVMFLTSVTEAGEEQLSLLTGTYGRFETLPNGEPGMVYPRNQVIPSLVVQLTVQDAIVWRVGIWERQAPTIATPAPVETGEDTDSGTPLLGGSAQTAPTAPPPAVSQPLSDVEPVTLLVLHQDALVLKYLLEMGADLDLVLREGRNTEPALTDPVWFRYILERYQLPGTMPDLPVAPIPVREPLELTPIAPSVEE
ncbi:MAG TPA: hypothetical protein ENN14_00155 [Chloroflexi bacterium]|nr:hypothetical protein [Chloroflexota bacterium]